jgi:general stress protein 26
MSNEPASAAEARRRVTELIRAARICMLTTTAVDGHLASRPMGLQEAEFDGDLWFFTSADSAKVRHLRVNPEVNVAFADQQNKSWVSLTGTASENFDRERAEWLWSPMLTLWFPDGLDTPHLTMVRVHVRGAEYWDSSASTVVNLLGFARAAVTGKPPRLGENEAVTF